MSAVITIENVIYRSCHSDEDGINHMPSSSEAGGMGSVTGGRGAGAPPQGGGGDGGTRPPNFESAGDNPPIFRKIVGQIR